MVMEGVPICGGGTGVTPPAVPAVVALPRPCIPAKAPAAAAPATAAITSHLRPPPDFSAGPIERRGLADSETYCETTVPALT